MAIYSDLPQALKEEPLSSRFSTVGSVIFAFAVPTVGVSSRDPLCLPRNAQLKNNGRSPVFSLHGPVCFAVHATTLTSFLTHDLEQTVALNYGIGESSDCMGETSVQLV